MADQSDNKQANLGDLISRIKSEGIEEASKKAEEIIARAKEEAAKIVDEAKKKGDDNITKAGKEAEELKRRGIESLNLAARDSVIALRRSIEKMFRSIILKECNEALTGEALRSVIGKVVEAWHKSDKEGEGLEILLSEKDLKGLSHTFTEKLGKAFEKGIEVKGRAGLKGGFRAGQKGGEMYYDFSDEAVTDLLYSQLAPELAVILDEGSKREEEH